jgi:hypothetical protein
MATTTKRTRRNRKTETFPTVDDILMELGLTDENVKRLNESVADRLKAFAK